MANMNFDFLGKYFPYYIDGAIVTIIVAIIVVALGCCIGTLIALMKLSKYKVLNWIANIYVEVLRGTPMLLQVLIGFIIINIDFGSFQLGILTIDSSRLIAGIIVLGLNSGAYVAEIVRGGINSVGNGQMEAAQSLGMKPYQAMRYIIFPQAIRNILPALGNEFITVIKDSSLLSTIGIMELLNGSQTVVLATYQALSPLLVAGAFYFIMTFVTSRLLSVYERHLGKAYAR